ncbi:MAG: hypothetical protein ACLFV7_08990 [Phycisphaerae bacterium]
MNDTTLSPEGTEVGQTGLTVPAVPVSPAAKAGQVQFRCTGCGRSITTSERWIGRAETCPYCQTRNVLGGPTGQGAASDARSVGRSVQASPSRTAANALLCGLLALVLGFAGLFGRMLFGEVASVAAIGLGLFAAVLGIRARGELSGRSADFPARSVDRERVIIRSGFGGFFGLVGAAMAILGLVLAVASMHLG